MSPSRLVLFVVAALLAAGCFQQPMPDLSGLPDRPADFPMDRYRGLAAEGWSVYEVDPTRSLVRIYVYRAGRMKRLGHNHVISATEIGGLAAARGNELRTDLYLPVAKLLVDDPALRASAGEEFQSELSEDDKEGTRANMLSEKVLHAQEHPFLKAGVSFAHFEAGENEVVAGIRIRGVRRAIRVPVTIERRGMLRVSGRFSLKQSDFDMEPFSILGGAVAVADQIDVEFELAFAPPPSR